MKFTFSDGDNMGNDIPTHIKKYDRIIGGGIPKGSNIVIYGPPGSKKSTLAFYIFGNALKNKLCKKGRYYIFEQNITLFKNQMHSLGLGDLLDYCGTDSIQSFPTVTHVSDFLSKKDVPGTYRDVCDISSYPQAFFNDFISNHITAIKSDGVDLVVFDSLSLLDSIIDFNKNRYYLHKLFDMLGMWNVTGIFISERFNTPNQKAPPEFFLSDGIFKLRLSDIDKERWKIYISCEKLRNKNIAREEFILEFKSGVFQITIGGSYAKELERLIEI